MAVDERSRHELYLKLEETLGSDAATTLMEHLPGVGWADVATKHDLDREVGALRADLRAIEERLTLRFEATLHRELARQSRSMIFAMIGVMLTMGSLTLTAIHLA